MYAMFSMISWYDAGIFHVLCLFLHYSASNSQCSYAMAFSIPLFAKFFCCVSQFTTHCIVVRNFEDQISFCVLCERWKSDVNLQMLWAMTVQCDNIVNINIITSRDLLTRWQYFNIHSEYRYRWQLDLNGGFSVCLFWHWMFF